MGLPVVSYATQKPQTDWLPVSLSQTVSSLKHCIKDGKEPNEKESEKNENGDFGGRIKNSKNLKTNNFIAATNDANQRVYL